MSKGIAVAFFAEGPTDHRFLDRLIERTMTAELAGRGLTVDLGSIQRLPAFAHASVTSAFSKALGRWRAGFTSSSSTPTLRRRAASV